MNKSYKSVMSRKSEIMKNALNLDYTNFEKAGISFDYEKMMNYTKYTLEDVREIDRKSVV